MIKGLVVWDFHGVLETGNERVVGGVCNLILEEEGYKERISEADCIAWYGQPINRYFSRVLPQSEEGEWVRLANRFVTYEGRFEMVRQKVKVTSAAPGVIRELQDRGYDQVLISNVPQEVLDRFVEIVGLEEAFPLEARIGVVVHGQWGGRNKQDVLREFIEDKSYERLVTIGDSAHDMELVEVLPGLRFLYAHEGIPFREGAEFDYQIRDLREVLKYV